MYNLFIIIFIILLFHYLYFLLKILIGLKKIKPAKINELPDEFISIIIPFRNESENILKNLESISSQTYPEDKFEVIYVNDFSDDDSFEKLITASKRNNIKVISVPADFSVNAHKKRAIRYGIENALGEIIITTDADCTYDKDWLKIMASQIDKETGFISGPVKFENNGTVFEKLQELEFAGLVLTGAGLIGSGSPTICNAANIVYRKSVFERVDGFKDQMNLSSGDDELLMQKIHKSTSYKIKFCWNENAVVKTNANRSLSQFYHQRKRWASKGLFYADKLLIIKLILIFLFYLSFPVQLIFVITWSIKFLFVFVLSIVTKLELEYRILNSGKNFLQYEKEFNFYILAELLHIPYIIIAGFSGLFGNYIWKQRKIKR